MNQPIPPTNPDSQADQNRLAELEAHCAGLQQQNADLNALYDTTLDLVSRLNVHELLTEIMIRAGVLLGTAHGYVALVEAHGTTIKLLVGLGVFQGVVGTELHPGEGFTGTIWQHVAPLAAPEYTPWPPQVTELPPVAIGVPLLLGDAVIGVLGLGYRQTPLDHQRIIRLLQRFAQLVALAIENARLLESATQRANQLARANQQLQELAQALSVKNATLRTNLTLARDIQMGLLPEESPWTLQQAGAHARSVPADEVGGDFYNYLTVRSDYIAVAVGDVSGKGVAAALMMALVSSTIEVYGREIEFPSVLLTFLNSQLLTRLKGNKMNAAVAYVVFDLTKATCSVANAGMIAPYLLRHGQVRMIEASGLPLGALGNVRYSQVDFALRPGDVILLVSDGIVEARNTAGEMFGFERLEAAIVRSQVLEQPQQMVNELITRVISFMGRADQHDDMTLVAIWPNLDGSLAAGGADRTA